MKVIIDRFEGGFAICEKENGTMIKIERSILPQDTREGSVLMVEGRKVTHLEAETHARQQKITGLMKGLWK
ncbi:MAG: DUF3006 domain-containing protein [Clostridia bacterium]|nr:DUF3006 domain-containing protein [Clostridia bacterium]